MPTSSPCASISAPPELPEIDGRVGLDEILEGREPELAASGRAHDALRHRLAESVGVADGQHDVPDPQRVRAPRA
jgi:hypothetical protein